MNELEIFDDLISNILNLSSYLQAYSIALNIDDYSKWTEDPPTTNIPIKIAW